MGAVGGGEGGRLTVETHKKKKKKKKLKLVRNVKPGAATKRRDANELPH